jgi:hypothetical protein
MSRSKHITRKEAFSRFVDGDLEAAAEYSEKLDLKKEYTKHRSYMAQVPGNLKFETVPNSAFLSVLKKIKRGG